MVKYLDQRNFAPYGTVMLNGTENGNLNNDELVNLKGISAHMQNVISGQILLRSVENMTVLAVSAGNGIDYFYLDKTVMIPAGISYALVPVLGNSAIVSDISGAQLRETDIMVSVSDFSVTRSLDISNIYTVMYQEREKGFLFTGERHETAELFYVDRGSIHNVVSGVETEMEQGSMMIFAPGHWHMHYSDADEAPAFATISFNISCPYIDLITDRKFVLDNVSAGLIHDILAENSAPSAFSQDIMITRLQTLIINALSKRPQDANLRKSSSRYTDNRIIDIALSFIGSSVYSQISVADAANAASVSQSYLTALFRQYMKISPGDYIRRSRLEESKALIRDGRYNFSQIAQMLNYSSIAHFSAQFKSFYGYTPTQYARMVRPDSD